MEKMTKMMYVSDEVHKDLSVLKAEKGLRCMSDVVSDLLKRSNLFKKEVIDVSK